MKKHLVSAVGVPLATMMLLAHPAAAQDRENKDMTPVVMAAKEGHTLGMMEISASDTIGTPVYNLDGEHLGEIEDLLIRGEDRVVLAIVGVGGFLGVNEHDVALPYDEFVRVGDSLYLYGADKDALEALPSYGGEQSMSELFAAWKVDAEVKREIYERRMAERFENWKYRLDTFSDRTGREVSRNLQTAWNEVDSQWDRLGQASGEAWREAQEGLESSWNKFLDAWSQDSSS